MSGSEHCFCPGDKGSCGCARPITIRSPIEKHLDLLADGRATATSEANARRAGWRPEQPETD